MTMQTAIRIKLCLLLGAAIFGQAQAQVSLESPAGGWRHSQGEAAGFSQQVNYPASSVNAEGHSGLALVKGHIKGASKERPAQLIINGVSMPLSVDDTGNFQRPWSFGASSNS